MIFSAKLIKKILGIAGAVVFVLIVGVFFPPESEKNENSQVFVNSAEIRGALDESIIQDDLEIYDIDESNGEILRFVQNDHRINDGEERVKIPEQKNELYKVVKVIDGDTIVVDTDGKKETIRLIGIDAPEIGGGSQKKKCFGKEAEEFAKNILSDANIGLEKDETQNDRDKYGRLLRYAVMENGNNFNEQMIRGGLAREYTYKTAYKYQKEFKLAEQEARKSKKGLWDACYNNNDSDGGENSNSGDSLISVPILGTGDCHCESNKYNCPDFKTHNEVQSLFECCVKKVGSDIHKLDGNNDGQVCESLP